MDTCGMLSFIQNGSKFIKSLTQFKSISVVLGNETCDLDSAVASLVYGLLINQKKSADTIVIPVFNIPRIQLAVKTEVIHVLHKYNFDLNMIVCRDEIDLMALQEKGALRLTLVDHHVLPPCDHRLAASVVEVIDHRPQNPAWLWTHARLDLRVVGSCCTLVAERLFLLAAQLVSPIVAEMLMGPILLDTACLSKDAGRATLLDIVVADRLQERCPSLDRHHLFTELQTAKSDISSLTSSQLLIKDLKVTAGIPIAGLPIKVKEFLSRDDAEAATEEFCKQYNAIACVIYGQRVEEGSLTRDIAVYSYKKPEAASEIVAAILNCTEPSLDLQPEPCSVPGFSLFNQLNIKATRKQVLPIVTLVGEQLRSSKKHLVAV